MTLARATGAALLASLLGAACCSPASAEVLAGRPDESIQQAYGPIVPNVTYSGALDDTGYDDVDYLAFDVGSAGQSVHFRVTNSTQSCNDPNGADCPVYATLMDATDQQLGGSTSSAGTVATAGDTETIDWTFSKPGRYYLLMESDGDLPPGNPAYAVGFTSSAGGASGSGGPAVTSLKVAAHQRGNLVRASLVFAQPGARLSATLVALGPRGRTTTVASMRRSSLPAGPYRLALRLPPVWMTALRRQHRLSLLLKLTVVPAASRQVSYTRRVAFTR